MDQMSDSNTKKINPFFEYCEKNIFSILKDGFSNFDLIFIKDKIKSILTNPTKFWDEEKNTDYQVKDLYSNYLIFLSIIFPIAVFIDNKIFSFAIIPNFLSSSLIYITLLGITWLTAFCVYLIAPLLGSEVTKENSFKLVCFSLTPVLISGVLYLADGLVPLIILASTYSIYIFAVGCNKIIGFENDKNLIFTTIISVINIVVTSIALVSLLP